MAVLGTRSRWTAVEDARLRSIYPTMSAVQVTKVIGCSAQAIRARSHKIGLTTPNQTPGDLSAHVVSLYISGLTMSEVQELTGLSYHRVRKCLAEAGMEVDRSRAAKKATVGQVRHFTPEEWGRVETMWDAHASIAAIASDMGCCKQVVARFASEHLPARELSETLSIALRREFTQKERNRIVQLYTTNMKTDAEVSETIGCSRQVLRRVLREEGVDTKAWGRRKQSEVMKEGYRSGRLRVSPKAGRGTMTYCDTPFQGTVRMRSFTESVRATELDAGGTARFYEIRRYVLSGGSTYLPDFWITQEPVEAAKAALGADPAKDMILAFLDATPHCVEDVKGWYGLTHPSKSKIDRFQQEHPGINFNVHILNVQR